MSPLGQAQLDRWGISIDDAALAELFEADAHSVFPDLPRGDAIVIPYIDPRTRDPMAFQRDGQAWAFGRVRWLTPRVAPVSGFLKLKVIRYAQPQRSGVFAYFAPFVNWQESFDVGEPIVITEGEAKGIVGCLHGFATVALGGVFSFQAKTGKLLPELEQIPWEGRDVYIAFDSDASTNPDVMAAEARLVEALQRQRGARVRIVRLAPDGEAKVGLDDFIKAHGANAFQELCLSSPSLGALDAKVMEFNTRCAWIERESMIWDFEQQQLIRKDSFVAGSRHSTHNHIVATTKGTKEINVAQAWLRHPYAQRFGEVLFRPGEGEVALNDIGQPALNMWKGFVEEPGDVQPFLDLTEHVFAKMRGDARSLPLALIAYKAQNPAEKIPLALLMVGTQGSGKSLWAECLRQAFGAYGEAIHIDRLVGQFNGWIEKSLLVVVNEVGVASFHEHFELIKSLISELRTPMEEKFRPMRTVNAYGLYILNSNKRGVGSLDVDDRRFIVVDTPEPREKAFYDRCGEWLKAGGAKRLMHYLLNFPLGGWKPPQVAPSTDEKVIAFHEGLTPVQALANDMKTAQVTMVETWLDVAAAWAQRAEMSNQIWQQQLAAAIKDNLSTIQIKPWYTAQELAIMFPSIIEQTQGARISKRTSAGQISRELREAGIPYLKNIDNPAGFWHRGVLKQYLIVSDFEEWANGVRQADFERLIDHFPTYGQVKAQRRRPNGRG